MKPYLIVLSLLVTFVLILPATIVLPYSQKQQAAQLSPKTAASPQGKKVTSGPTDRAPLTVSVYRSGEEKVETLPLEQYVIGVVASEMPAKFNEEALKAQALAARTYIVNFLLQSPDMNIPEKAQVTDTEMNQVYHDTDELKKMWAHDYDWKISKIQEAVRTTKGEIITYNGNPITPSFFSTSNGYTENSEDYWQSSTPYLKSVKSPWDRKSPKFSSDKKMSVQAFNKKLGVHISKQGKIGKVIKTTSGHRIGKIKIDDKSFTGRKIREKLELRSSDFSIKRKGDQVKISTQGFGHGVGMSQFGANGMAEEGKTYQEIVQHYYQGVAISNAQPYTAKLTN